ncbi:hypothetical protein DLAC_09275 [Tieghemostelium lacteum]|uniref:Uncharacterized protein n=1 Tax=Tieghemostelium lacteum TaxID=361077 RepID=A0A151Z9N0_TIELA|nr:hypothetical protein DLAC_09275 [Tieghemostelium lacteum]|eukprot:KYQ90643.1 hypothetical protein DLAC_09275 [Tieghemostelium lacteum]
MNNQKAKELEDLTVRGNKLEGEIIHMMEESSKLRDRSLKTEQKLISKIGNLGIDIEGGAPSKAIETIGDIDGMIDDLIGGKFKRVGINLEIILDLFKTVEGELPNKPPPKTPKPSKPPSKTPPKPPSKPRAKQAKKPPRIHARSEKRNQTSSLNVELESNAIFPSISQSNSSIIAMESDDIRVSSSQNDGTN